MNVYKPSQLADKLKVSNETLRLWSEQGKIKAIKTASGHRRYIYNEEDNNNEKQRLKIIYARVSSKKQEDDLKRQITFLQKRYPKYKIISDIGSGINFNRKGFNKILEAIVTGTVDEIVVAHKDRLCRFGYEIVENICKYFATTITIVEDNVNKSETDELAEDLLSIITVFTARFYGQRKYKTKKTKNKEQKEPRESTRKLAKSRVYNKKV